MKPQWSAVLAAFDREIPLLKALRAEYDGYVRGCVESAWARLPPSCTDIAQLDVSVEDGVMGATVRLLGDQARAGLEIQIWPAVEYGGPEGLLRWVLVAPDRMVEGFPPLERAVRVAREASSGVVTEPVHEVPADFDALTEHAALRWGSLPLGDADLPARLARVLTPAISALDAAARAVLALHVTTPRSWLEAQLLAMRAEGAFAAEGATTVGKGSWAVGVSVNPRVSTSDYCWFTACNDGRLTFHWEPPKAEKETRRQAVVGALPAYLPSPSGGWHGVVVLDVAGVAGLQAAGDAAGARALVLDIWRRYRAACLAATGG